MAVPRTCSRPLGGTLRLLALGGLGEIGMNCLALEQRGDVVVIDCGVTFPHVDQGVDVIHPRFDWLVERAARLRGVVLTHGHEDHIGALPYLALAIQAAGRDAPPIWGPSHALALARRRLDEHGFEADEIPMHTTRPGERFDVGSLSLESIRVTHSIADATALAITTEAGVVVHTGDFKLDPAPPDGELTDEARFEALGHEGVRLLLSDSTNVDAPGRAESESEVAIALEAHVARAKARVVVGMFSSNVQRMILLGEIARKHRRAICLLGRSVATHAAVARELGRLVWPSDLVVAPEVAAGMPRERLLVLAGGTQAERGSGLVRLAQGSHPAMRIDAGDLVVVLSSRIIPGNDRAVYELIAALLRRGVEVVSRATDRQVHASGHAHRDEQRRMIALTRPRAFVPLHGTLHHLVRHGELAREAGVDDVLVVENGQVVELDATGPLRLAEKAIVGTVSTWDGDPVPDEVLRDRAALGRAGVAFVSLVVEGGGAPRRAAARRAPRRPVAAAGRRRAARRGRRQPRGRARARRRRQRRRGVADRSHARHRAAHPRDGGRCAARRGRDRDAHVIEPPPDAPERVGVAASTDAAALLGPGLLALAAAARATYARIVTAGPAPDVEAVHDFRVALRRLRTTLRLARELYGRRKIGAVAADLREYAVLTGRLREDEVLRETLAALALDPASRFDADAWLARRARIERRTRAEVLAVLDPTRSARRPVGGPERTLPRVLDELTRRLERGPRRRRHATAGQIARAAAVEALDDVASHTGVALTDVVGMHELRIRFKRLRYTLELVGPALPDPVAAVTLAKGATKLQKRLGEVHDLDDALARMRRAWGVPAPSRGALVAALTLARAAAASRARDEVALELGRHAAFRAALA